MHWFDFLYIVPWGPGRPRGPRRSAAASRAAARSLVTALLPLLSALPLDAQLHVAAGLGSIHDGERGPAAEVGMRTALDAGGRITAGGALLAGTAGEGFASAVATVELRLDPDALFAPFAGLRGGVLAEPGGNHGAVGAVIGLAPRIGPGRRLRLAAEWSRHGREGGPRVLLLGLEFGLP